MAISDYCTQAEVRAALGVSATELPDATFLMESWSTMLTLDLEDVALDLPTQYATIAALGSRTSAQQRFYLLTRLFAVYSIARSAVSTLPMFGVSRLTDGKAEFQRIVADYKDIVESVEGMYGTVKLKLSAAFVVLNPLEVAYATPTNDMLSYTGIAVSPITNA